MKLYYLNIAVKSAKRFIASYKSKYALSCSIAMHATLIGLRHVENEKKHDKVINALELLTIGLDAIAISTLSLVPSKCIAYSVGTLCLSHSIPYALQCFSGGEVSNKNGVAHYYQEYWDHEINDLSYSLFIYSALNINNNLLKNTLVSMSIYVGTHTARLAIQHTNRVYGDDESERTQKTNLLMIDRYILSSFEVTALYQVIFPVASKATWQHYAIAGTFFGAVPHSLYLGLDYMRSHCPSNNTVKINQLLEQYILPSTYIAAFYLITNALAAGKGLTLYWVHQVRHVQDLFDYYILSPSLTKTSVINLTVDAPQYNSLKFFKEPMIAICKKWTSNPLERSMSLARSLSSLEDMDIGSNFNFKYLVYAKNTKGFICNFLGEFMLQAAYSANNSFYSSKSLFQITNIAAEFYHYFKSNLIKSAIKSSSQAIEGQAAKSFLGDPKGYYIAAPIRQALYDIVDIKKIASKQKEPKKESTEPLGELKASPPDGALNQDKQKSELTWKLVKIPQDTRANHNNVHKKIDYLQPQNIICTIFFNFENRPDDIGICYSTNSNANLEEDLFTHLEESNTYIEISVVGASCFSADNN